jgi:geranylgeranyl diphosphate synthase type I
MLQTRLQAPPQTFRVELENLLEGFLAERARQLLGDAPELEPALSELAGLTRAGGKRIRPWFVEWGHRAAGGDPDQRLAHAAAAVEMVHTFALVQDDIIDRSGLRRGRAAVHVALARGASHHHGLSAAILISDLALVWADMLLLESGYAGTTLERAFGVFNTLREEVTVGQFQDLAMTTFGVIDLGAALAVMRRKTGGYTIRRPLELGMTLAGGSRSLLAAAAAYAEPAGMAFQLRDDLLGAFGDCETTGKPAGDDLAQAKPTWLLARGLTGQGPAAVQLRRLIGKPERGPQDVALMRDALLTTGAVADAEAMIDQLRARALTVVDRFDVGYGLRAELVGMTERLVDRDR